MDRDLMGVQFQYQIDLVDGDVLTGDVVVTTIGELSDRRAHLRDTDWLSLAIDVDGDPVIIPRERVNFVRLHIVRC